MERLKRRPEFLAVARTGVKWVAPNIIVQIKKVSGESSCIRMGLTASKKVGGAVERNRAKRRLRVAFAQVVTENKMKWDVAEPQLWDFVVIARKEAVTCTFADLLRDMTRALQKAPVIVGAG